MASPPRRKLPALKPMPGFKKRQIPPKPAEPPAIIDLDDSKSPASSQGAAPASQTAPEKKDPKEMNDLEYWGRSKVVHASMLKRDEERRRQEAEKRRKAKAKAAEQEKQKTEAQDRQRSSKRRKSSEDVTIEISDDDDDNSRPRKTSNDDMYTPASSNDAGPTIATPSDVDRVLAEYRRKTEEKAAAAAAAAAASANKPPPRSISIEPHPTQAASQDPNDAFKDVIIDILIVSQIAGTKPKIFSRKFGQTLGRVRQTWGMMQGFLPEQLDQLILVWQNTTRVFDSTVPRSLGVGFDREGNMYLETAGRRMNMDRRDRDEQAAVQEGITPGDCKIVFDAMWEEDFEAMIKAREEAREREAAAWDLTDEVDEVDAEEAVTGTTLKVKSILVTFRGKNFKDLKLKLKPNMTVGEAILMIRKERELDEDTDIELRFEGDELEEDTTLEDADIEDDVQVDVVLR
ncbi:hypothetical protein Dda_2031 [Drechslerella dactyloides]|uniref:Ubiquitin-like domain-containing protein n=1 Tax=Drechslerella dactyloides TaxID=74499 RepID=A0AAD6NMA4_DREDA|nr:hypothetical protein Dda_2031 [Drechslerella dactyloides]